MMIPDSPKIYHIVHIDKLKSIVSDGCLWCEAEITRRMLPGTKIGLPKLKRRRLQELTLSSHPELYVGDCVPFYFCPRSVMLYMIHMGNAQELSYQGGQDPIVHLEADLYRVVSWANQYRRRWAFTLSNAGSYIFEDRCDLEKLDEINWTAVKATYWPHCKEGKQAEFLLEYNLPWHLIERIGVYKQSIHQRAAQIIVPSNHKPDIQIREDWYY